MLCPSDVLGSNFSTFSLSTSFASIGDLRLIVTTQAWLMSLQLITTSNDDKLEHLWPGGPRSADGLR